MCSVSLSSCPAPVWAASRPFVPGHLASTPIPKGAACWLLPSLNESLFSESEVSTGISYKAARADCRPLPFLSANPANPARKCVLCSVFCVPWGIPAPSPFPQGKGRRHGSPAGGEFTFRQLVLGRQRLRSSWGRLPAALCPTFAKLGVLCEKLCSVFCVL